MSSASAKVVQYGKRLSLKKKAPLESTNEPSLKRQKLVDDHQSGENHSPSHTAFTVSSVVALGAVCAANVPVSETSLVKTLAAKPRKIIGRDSSVASLGVREPRLLNVEGSYISHIIKCS
jgi:hypothetical protein